MWGGGLFLALRGKPGSGGMALPTCGIPGLSGSLPEAWVLGIPSILATLDFLCLLEGQQTGRATFPFLFLPP